jgi:hypothetical protein
MKVLNRDTQKRRIKSRIRASLPNLGKFWLGSNPCEVRKAIWAHMDSTERFLKEDAITVAPATSPGPAVRSPYTVLPLPPPPAGDPAVAALRNCAGMMGCSNGQTASHKSQWHRESGGRRDRESKGEMVIEKVEKID